MNAIVSEYGRKAHIGTLDEIGLPKASCKSVVYGFYVVYETVACNIEELSKELLTSGNDLCGRCFRNVKVGS